MQFITRQQSQFRVHLTHKNTQNISNSYLLINFVWFNSYHIRRLFEPNKERTYCLLKSGFIFFFKSVLSQWKWAPTVQYISFGALCRNSFYLTNLLLCILCRSRFGNIKEWKLPTTVQCWLAMVNLDLKENLPNSGQANVCQMQALQNIYGSLPKNQSKRGL